MNDSTTAVIRTIAAQLVGALATFAARYGGVQVDEGAALIVVTQTLTVATYVVVHWLETHVDRRFGWLLGVAKAPTYGAQ